MHFNFDNSVTRDDALRLTIEHWGFTADIEYVPLSAARGRVTAEDIRSENTLPVFRTSPFDGIAVKSAKFKGGTPDPSDWVILIDYVPADTGDDFPDAFDAIVAVEDLLLEDGKLVGFTEDVELISGDGLNQPGDIIKRGELIIAKNTKLEPNHMAILAMGGTMHVPVLRRPKVAFIPTGSELVPAGITPQRGQNIDANSLMIEAYLKKWGAEAVCFPIIRDDREILEKALNKALAIADIVLINGGSSKGVEDFNSALIKERASFFRHGVRAVPGRPVAVSIIGEKPVINVPGPVIAAWLAADWCVCGLVHHYYGLPMIKRQAVKAKLKTPIKAPVGFEALLRVNLVKSDSGYIVETIPRHGSTVKAVNCDGLLVVPIGVGYNEGDEVEVEIFRGLEYFE